MFNTRDNKMARMTALSHPNETKDRPSKQVIELYLCNGKDHCNVRRDGKKNEYCYANGIEEHCKYTSNEQFAKNKKKPRSFNEKGPYILDGNETYYWWEKED